MPNGNDVNAIMGWVWTALGIIGGAIWWFWRLISGLEHKISVNTKNIEKLQDKDITHEKEVNRIVLQNKEDLHEIKTLIIDIKSYLQHRDKTIM